MGCMVFSRQNKSNKCCSLEQHNVALPIKCIRRKVIKRHTISFNRSKHQIDGSVRIYQPWTFLFLHIKKYLPYTEKQLMHSKRMFLDVTIGVKQMLWKLVRMHTQYIDLYRNYFEKQYINFDQKYLFIFIFLRLRIRRPNGLNWFITLRCMFSIFNYLNILLKII